MERLEDFISRHSSDEESLQVNIIYYESHDDVFLMPTMTSTSYR